MQAFHIPALPPYYTNTFLLISDAGHAVIIDPAADVQNYEQILQEHNAVLTTLLCAVTMPVMVLLFQLGLDLL